ncbi:hypothetical protein [Pseudomonas sp. FeS53a]|jgi:filamentous hemagglutinin|uniref:hypothetical protein n=1 Tax=Pseudomonas sp. FeS53a TaxID=1604022 RepID=UPI000AF1D540|nr:hypothetical protein [Pseudomonas sp. FeS53a]
MEVVGAEMVVKGPLGDHRYEIVVRDINGKLHGIEVKSGVANKTSYQEFTDYFVIELGAQGKRAAKWQGHRKRYNSLCAVMVKNNET